MEAHSRGSGLLVVEQTAIPKDIAAQLRKLDPQLELRTVVDADWGMLLHRVFVSQGDRPSAFLFDWRETIGDHTSRPRPLSSAIVDEAASWDRNGRRTQPDPLAENDRLREREEQESRQMAEDAAREIERRKGRSPAFHRGRHLYLARNRARARGENV